VIFSIIILLSACNRQEKAIDPSVSAATGSQVRLSQRAIDLAQLEISLLKNATVEPK